MNIRSSLRRSKILKERSVFPRRHLLHAANSLVHLLFGCVSHSCRTRPIKSYILWDINAWISRSTAMFRRNVPPASSVSKNKHEADSFDVCLIYDDCLFSLFFYPEVGGDMFFRSVWWNSLEYTVLYIRIHCHRRQKLRYNVKWKWCPPQRHISH
jgi:hypothetical protein